MMRAVRGIAMCVTDTGMVLRTSKGNKHRCSKIKGIDAGDRIWIYFDRQGVVTDVVKFGSLTEEEMYCDIPEDELSDPDHPLGLGSWDL